MTVTAQQATAYAATGPYFGSGQCLHAVVTEYHLSQQTPENTAAQAEAIVQHWGQGVAPLGAIYWWLGGSRGDGHIALADGKGGCYSTDFTDAAWVDDGYVHHLSDVNNIVKHAPILTFKGWSYDLENVIVVPALEAKMILVNKTTVPTFVYRYDGDSLHKLSDHQVQRAQQLGAVLHSLPPTDDIFTLPVK